MQLPTKFFQPKPTNRHLLIVQLGTPSCRLAYFKDEDGELIFGGTATGPSPEEALKTLDPKPEHITDVVAGLPFSGLTDQSTVVRYRRSDPQSKIGEDEVKNALSQIPPLPKSAELFFEDLFNAKVDGLATLEPVERMGEAVEIDYYQVAAPKDILDQAKDKVSKLGGQLLLVPTAYAIAKLISQTAPKGALVINIESDQTEVSLSAEGNLVGIKSFDLGGSQTEHLLPALETALEEMEYPDPWPEQVYLCGGVGNYEAIRSQLLAYPWTKNVNMMGFPDISVFHPLSVNLTLPADVGLNALSLLG